MILDKICKTVEERYRKIKQEHPLEELKSKIDFNEEKNYRFYDLFKKDDFVFICECKKASPSKGIIKEDFNYLEIAMEYERAGAQVISCLTEPFFFLGSDEYFMNIKKNVSIPLLRKDFIIDSYQIYESKVLGADIILLIVAILTDEELKEYINLAHSLGMSCLVETHNEEEIERAKEAGAYVVGVNNRNLKDFSMDYDLSLRMRKKYPNLIMISESGLRDKEDVRNVKRAGSNGALIGESLMRSENITKTLKEYIDVR
jgi:indole-3-glycerol phosphate synthase